LNSRETLATELGVFADFEPKLSGRSLEADVLFLANIQPDLQAAVREVFDLRPGAFRKYLDLHRPIYQATSAYGHFGREDEDFPWERTDRVDALREATGVAEATPA
jgi:S-adenosylmethionine synthetase